MIQATNFKAGDVLRLTSDASPQFCRGLDFRFVRFGDRDSSVSGWVWIEGYSLDGRGMAKAKRSVFVLLSGLKLAPDSIGREQP